MAEGKDIPLIITVDTAKSIKTIGELKKGIADTRKELEKTEVGSKRFDELSASIKTAEGRLGDLNKRATALKDMPGPIGAIATSFSNVRTALIRAGAAMKTFTGLLAATGIGLLLVAFGSLMAYFKGTEEGAQRLRVIMAVLGAVVDQIKDVFIDLGKAMFDTFSNPKQAVMDFANLVKENIMNRFEGLMELIPQLGKAIGLLFKGEFAEAGQVALDATAKVTLGVEDMTAKINAAGDAMVDWVDNTTKVVTETELLEKALNRVKVAERELKVERAEANKLLAEQRFIAQDTTVAIEDRIKALQRASDIEDALTKKELENEKERLRIMEAKAKQASTGEAEFDALADQRVRVAQIEEQSMMRQRMLLRTINSLNKEEAAEAKRIADEKAAADAERMKAEADLRQQLRDSEIALIANAEEQELERSAEAFQRRMDAIIGESEIEGELRDSLLDERLAAEQAIKQKYIDLEAAAEKKRKADLISAEEKMAAAKVAAANAVGNALGQVANAIQGESEAAVTARKILGIAQIGIDTATAISGAISGGMTLPFPANIAAVATGIGTVVANIASAVGMINGVNVGGGSAPSPPSASSVSAPAIAPVTTNTTQLGNTEQVELAPVQAYVVETAITGNQNNIEQIESQSNFG